LAGWCLLGARPAFKSYLTFKNASYRLKSWHLLSTAQDLAINDVNRHLCAGFADPDRVALKSGVHLREQRASFVFDFIAK
jgi:hypothetical protein